MHSIKSYAIAFELIYVLLIFFALNITSSKEKYTHF